ncbi:hypothetical protein [Telluribacter sp.]|jgi:hypothetical protein|uniref:hypothetical protein n=1 Tax=Telluribacter sp. TaxID=1978767 RepID=UPI002E0E45CD|nr:hypothetical protein [Telluribacter sp.]
MGTLTTRQAPSIYLPRLNTLKEQYNATKYPNVAQTRGFYAKKYSDNSSNALTAAIVAYLNLTGGYATRQQSMGVKRKVKGREIWTPGTTRTGATDVQGMYQGRSLQIEVKYGRDRMSEAQKKTAAHVTRAGGVHIVARTFDGFIEQFTAAFGLADQELFVLRCPVEEDEEKLSCYQSTEYLL